MHTIKKKLNPVPQSILVNRSYVSNIEELINYNSRVKTFLFNTNLIKIIIIEQRIP